MTFTALLFFSAYWWFRTQEDRQRMLQALCVGLFLSSVAGMLDFAIDINPIGIEGRASGFVGDPNAMAESIGSMMFVPLFLLLRGRELGCLARFAAASYALAAVAVVVSLSRGNWIAFVAAHFVFLRWSSNRVLLVGGAVVAARSSLTIGFPLLPEVVRERIAITTTTGDRVVYQVPLALNLESSTASRVVFARIGLDMFGRSPIWGHGLHAFNFRTPEFGAKYGVLIQKDPHNLAVKMAADAGLIGLGVLGWVIWAVFRCGRRLWRCDLAGVPARRGAAGGRDARARRELSATSFLYAKQISAQFWILFALSARAYVERDAEPEEPAGAGRCRRAGGAGSPRGRRPRCPSCSARGSARDRPRPARGGARGRRRARATARANGSAPSATSACTPGSSRSKPSQVIGLAIIALPIARPAWSLFFMPAPKRSGLSTTVARARYGRTSSTKPVTITRRPVVQALRSASGGAGPITSRPRPAARARRAA